MFLRIVTWGAVTGWSHILVFIAGQKRRGFAGSQARATHVNILSQIPLASLPSVLASKGAIRKTSAHLTRSICRTGSPLSCQAAHSTVSESTCVPGGSSASFRKCLALSVTTIRISKLWCQSLSTSCGSFIVATLPVQPISTFFREVHAILTNLMKTDSVVLQINKFSTITYYQYLLPFINFLLFTIYYLFTLVLNWLKHAAWIIKAERVPF